MNSTIETNILECLHRLDEPRKAEVLDFVEYLVKKFNVKPAGSWPDLEPTQDFARFAGKLIFDEDAVAYQRRIRDSEWT